QAQDFDLPLGPEAMPPAVVLERIHERAAELVEAQYRCWHEVLCPPPDAAGQRVLAARRWGERRAQWLRDRLRDGILPRPTRQARWLRGPCAGGPPPAPTPLALGSAPPRRRTTNVPRTTVPEAPGTAGSARAGEPAGSPGRSRRPSCGPTRRIAPGGGWACS